MREQLEITNTFIRRLASSIGPEGEFREHGCSGPFTLCVPSSSTDTSYRFDGVYTAHIHNIIAFNKSDQEMTWPSTSTNFIIHEQEGEASQITMFSAFLFTLCRNAPQELR
jgi:hypothetical protein